MKIRNWCFGGQGITLPPFWCFFPSKLSRRDRELFLFKEDELIQHHLDFICVEMWHLVGHSVDFAVLLLFAFPSALSSDGLFWEDTILHVKPGMIPMEHAVGCMAPAVWFFTLSNPMTGFLT